jgi:hypothetical protein
LIERVHRRSGVYVMAAITAVELLDCLGCFLAVFHGHEAEASRFASASVFENHRICDVSERTECLAQFLLADG